MSTETKDKKDEALYEYDLVLCPEGMSLAKLIYIMKNYGVLFYDSKLMLPGASKPGLIKGTASCQIIDIREKIAFYDSLRDTQITQENTNNNERSNATTEEL